MTYTYDENGNLVSEVEAGIYGVSTITYAYDCWQ